MTENQIFASLRTKPMSLCRLANEEHPLGLTELVDPEKAIF